MSEEKFVLAPVAVIRDRRLTLIETRVLLTLLSFRATPTDNTIRPHREKLCERCGYSPKSVSVAVSGLVEQGWVIRRQHRGPNTYELKVPEAVTEIEGMS